VLTTIDALIGFIGVMLVLSLAVTALVQLVQNFLQLRAKNLRVGIQALFEKFFEEPSTGEDVETEDSTLLKRQRQDRRRTNLNRAFDLRDKVLKLAPFVPEENTTWISRLFSPTTSWVSFEELLEHLRTAGVTLSDAEKERLSLLFARMEDYLRKRFTLNVRLITIASAFVVGGYFQLSTPALLTRLSTDDKYRAQAVAAAERVYKEAPALIVSSTDYQNVSTLALDQLAQKHPEHIALFERASGQGESRDDIVAELRAVLRPLRADVQSQILADYDKALTDLHRKAIGVSGEQFAGMTERLAKFDITPWPYGWNYYATPQNIIGVLITVFFLTFGAPFWYERLRDLIQLRDALKPKRSEGNVTEGKQEETPPKPQKKTE